jgi:hypothetical protein
MKRFFKFLFRPLFLINLILALGSAVLIFYFIMSYIHDYTNHDDKYHTPNFIGVHVDDIDEFIKAKEIKYIIRDSVFSDDYQHGTVIRQDPDYYSKEKPNYIKPHRTMYLTIVKMEGEYKLVPDLLSNNTSKSVGKTKLSMAGFKIEYEIQPHKDMNKILDLKHRGKSIDKGTKLLKNSVITIVYGSGTGGAPVVLPLLIGQNVYEATNKLKEIGLEVKLHYDSALNADDSINFVVYRQNPNPKVIQDGLVAIGSSVLLLSKRYTVDTNSVLIDTTTNK